RANRGYAPHPQAGQTAQGATGGFGGRGLDRAAAGPSAPRSVGPDADECWSFVERGRGGEWLGADVTFRTAADRARHRQWLLSRAAWPSRAATAGTTKNPLSNNTSHHEPETRRSRHIAKAA